MNPRVAVQSAEQLRAYLQRGNPGAGMPAFADLPAEDLLALARYLRRINVETIIPPPAAAPQRTVAWGPPQPGDWRTYNGNESGNRYSALTQITRANVASLKLKWVFPMPYFGLEVTPLAADGVLYVTGPNQVVALDATTGRALWTYSRPPTPGLVGDSQLGTNRGVALRGDKVFFVTDNAHLLALDRGTGALRWETADGAGGAAVRAGVTTTAARSRRWSSATWSWPASPARMRAFAASSRPSTLRPARWCGAAGRCRVAASAASRPGRVRSRSEAAGRPG